MSVGRPEVDERVRRSHGKDPASILSGMRDLLARTYRQFTRAQEHIPNTPKFASDREFFRLLKSVPDQAKGDSIRIMMSVVEPLGEKQLELFEKYLVLSNLSTSIELGQPLRFGFESKEEVDAELARFQELVEATPEVANAVATRREIVFEMVGEMVDLGLLPESTRENTESYYHKQVSMYSEGRGGRCPALE